MFTHALNVTRNASARPWRCGGGAGYLRNHGSLLTPRGWRLAPACDRNANPEGEALALNVFESENAIDLDLALAVAPTFRVSIRRARAVVAEVLRRAAAWGTVAAEGLLAYTPEAPPARDSAFHYEWLLPQVRRPGLRRHVYFGALHRDDARDVFAFWRDARRGVVQRSRTTRGARWAAASRPHRGLPPHRGPIAVYRHTSSLGDSG